MNTPIRLLVSGVTILCGVTYKTCEVAHPAERRGAVESTAHAPRKQEHPDGTLKIAVIGPARGSFSHLDTRVFPSPAPDRDPGSAPATRDSYQAIIERNPFHLKSPALAALPPAMATEPTEDLFLTGMASLGDRRAFFMLIEPGRPPAYFTLREGEENEWLEVKSMDLDTGALTARLKKPVVRIRNVGVDVVLSFDAHGINKH